jgi:hypothetical protein
MNRMRNRIITAILIPGIILAISLLVIASPLALQVIDSHSNANWVQLSNIGQTYGAVSALLSALALVGVAVSVLMQNRELRHDRWEAGRARHFDIIRMALDDPLYRQVFSIPGPQAPDNEARLVGYINMLFEYWKMMWEFGDWSETQLRACFRDVLSTSAGYSYWTKYGDGRARLTRTKNERIFERAANEVYRDLPSPARGDADAGKRHAQPFTPNLTQGAGFILGVITACVAVSSWRKCKIRRLPKMRHKSLSKKGNQSLRLVPD